MSRRAFTAISWYNVIVSVIGDFCEGVVGGIWYSDMKPLFVSTRVLENYVGTDGQRFTNLISSWAKVYMRRNGASNFSINDVAWRPDGGVDGELARTRAA